MKSTNETQAKKKKENLHMLDKQKQIASNNAEDCNCN